MLLLCSVYLGYNGLCHIKSLMYWRVGRGDSLEGAMALSRMQLRCALCGLSSGNVTEELLKAPRGLWWS